MSAITMQAVPYEQRNNSEFIAVGENGIRVLSSSSELTKKAERTLFRINEPYKFVKDGTTFVGVKTFHLVDTNPTASCAEEAAAQAAASERAQKLAGHILLSTNGDMGETLKIANPFTRARLGLPVLCDASENIGSAYTGFAP